MSTPVIIEIKAGGLTFTDWIEGFGEVDSVTTTPDEKLVVRFTDGNVLVLHPHDDVSVRLEDEG